eukprot:6113854-Pyramimonas_sp.AAC.1
MSSLPFEPPPETGNSGFGPPRQRSASERRHAPPELPQDGPSEYSARPLPIVVEVEDSVPVPQADDETPFVPPPSASPAPQQPQQALP